CMQGTHLRTF
nr:immunoglobulin light chain junction region [Macaca mulatta]MOV77044.1 immunoglobulin light chain junction region [Macaca mulatta]